MYILDTNSIIYYTDDEPAVVATLEPLFTRDHPIYISTLTEVDTHGLTSVALYRK